MVAKNVDMVDDLVVFFFFLVLGLACKGATIGPSCAWVFRSCPSTGRGKACMVSVVGGAAAVIAAGANEGYEAGAVGIGAEAGATVVSTGSDTRMRAGIAAGAETGAGAACDLRNGFETLCVGAAYLGRDVGALGGSHESPPALVSGTPGTRRNGAEPGTRFSYGDLCERFLALALYSGTPYPSSARRARASAPTRPFERARPLS